MMKQKIKIAAGKFPARERLMFTSHPLDNGICFSFRRPHATYYGTVCSRERIHLVTRAAKTFLGEKYSLGWSTSSILARDMAQN